MNSITEPKTNTKPPGFLLRLAARIIDDVLLLIPVLVAGELVYHDVAGKLGYLGPELPFVSASLIMMLTYFLISCLYYSLLHGTSGQTIGKRLMHLKVVHKNGSPIPLDQAFGRWFVSLASGLLFGYGYLLAIWEPQKRTLHDRIACTKVIRH